MTNCTCFPIQKSQSLFRYRQRCQELQLLKRCIQLEPREATENELLKVHTPEMITILKNTAAVSDEEALENLSSKYDFLYIHPVTMPLFNFGFH